MGKLNGRLITSNQGDETLSVIDPSGGKLQGELLAPIVEESNMEMLHELSMDPGGGFLVVGLMEMPAGWTTTGPLGMGYSTLPGYLLKLGSDSGTLQAKAQVDPNPGDNALSPDGKLAYVTHYDLGKILRATLAGDTNVRDMDSNLYVIDTGTMAAVSVTPLCAAAHVAEVSADGKTLYATCVADEIAVVDVTQPASPQVVRVPELSTSPENPASPMLSPYALNVSPLDRSVWVSNFISGDVRVMDAASRTFVAALESNGWTPYFISFSADGSRGYVAHQSPGGVAEYDGRSRALITDHLLAAPACLNPHQVIPSDDGTSAFVLCEGDHVHGGQFALVDLATWNVSKSTTIGIYPVEMDLMPPRR